MGINKIVYGGVTKLDISNDTVTPSSLMEGYTAHDNTGTLIVGTASGGGDQGNVWQDGEGNVHLDDESGLSLQTKTVTPSGSTQVVTADAGYYALEQVNVNAVETESLTVTPTTQQQTFTGAPETVYSMIRNITVTEPVTVDTSWAVNGTKYLLSGWNKGSFQGDTAKHFTNVEVTWNNGFTCVPTSETNYSITFTDGQFDVHPYRTTWRFSISTTGVSGYLPVVVDAMPTGTEGTPTATKGTVSNHSVSVTPSVTNTTGYITGSTKTGTAVTVSASELVSGTKSITENGTGIDVTNYASVDVSVSGGGGSSITVDPLSVTTNGTYTAPSGHAYSPVTVNVSGGDTPTPWVRPSSWPDLSKMDVSAGDIIYMTSYADEARGFCSFYVSCTGSYTVEVGTISGSVFTAESTEIVSSGTRCRLYYGSANGTYKVLRVTGTAITKFNLGGETSAITIDAFKGHPANNGIIDVVGKLPSCTNMAHSSCYNLINMKIDAVSLSGTVGSIFSDCSSLVSLDVSNWDVSNVTNMNGMFSYCPSLTFLDVSNWVTSSVTNMTNMFGNCYTLRSLDVSNWDVSNVKKFASTFSNCQSLTSLDVSNWVTSSVTDMSNMFYNCNSLTSLDVSNWVTSSVTSMSYMFQNCYSLTSLDVSDWVTSSVTNMTYMFQNCYSLTSLDVSNWVTSSVTNMAYMFDSCYSLTSLDVSDWVTSSVTNMTYMFCNCRSFVFLDISNFDFTKVTTSSNTNYMLRYCRGLHGSIIIPASITTIGTNFLADTRNLYEYHFLSTTPPTLANTNAFNNMTDFGGKKIYVPSASLSAYQTAAKWSTYASYMVGE